MNDDFKQVLTFLYQEFGDQGMVWVQEQVAAHLSGAAADTSAEDDSDAYEPDGPANETMAKPFPPERRPVCKIWQQIHSFPQST